MVEAGPMGHTSARLPCAERACQRRNGYTLLIVMFAIFLLMLGLMIAVPVWQTQILRELEEENRRLKQMYAELSLEHQVLKDVVEKIKE